MALINPLLNFSRPSSGFFQDANGLIANVGNNVPRFGATGVLMAGARVNRMLWNRDLTNAVWRKVNASVALAATGADGAADAASVVTATSADAWVAQYGSASTAGSHGLSVMLRRRTGTGDVRLGFGATTGGAVVGTTVASYDFAAATGWTLSGGFTISGGKLNVTNATGQAFVTLPADVQGGLAYQVTYTIESISGGTLRARLVGGANIDLITRNAPGTYSEVVRMNVSSPILSFIIVTGSGTLNAVIDNVTVRPYMGAPIALTSAWQRFVLGADLTTATRPNPALGIYLANAGDEIDVDFVQGEEGTFSTFPTGVTTSAAVTRADELLSRDLASLGVVAARGFTLVGRAVLSQSAPTGIDQLLWQVDDSTNTNRYALLNVAAGNSVQTRIGAITGGALFTMTPGTSFSFAATVDVAAGSISVSINGGAVVTQSGGPTSGMQTLRFASNATPASFLFGALLSHRLFPAPLALADLPALSLSV